MSSPSSPCRSTPPMVSMKGINIENFEEEPESLAAFHRIASQLCGGKRVIVITGAGISVSSGIPDFRSAGGLYERLGLKFGNNGAAVRKEEGGKMSIRGKDFFDASFFHAEKTRPLFYKFIAELKEMCDGAGPTRTHAFLKGLVEEKRVMRWYTQNIDGLEERVGLATTVSSPSPTAMDNVPVVGLHGTLSRLSCTVCKSTEVYGEQHEKLKNGQSPDCRACAERSAAREERGQRRLRSGILRPDIVLYNEPHPQGDLIAELLATDLARRPTMLLVVGTSLKVVGLKRMVKDVARAVRANCPDGGLCVFLNKTEVQGRSEWRSVFDYELVGECDRWVEHFERVQTEIKNPVKKEVEDVIAKPVKKEVIKPKVPKQETKTEAKIETFFKHVKSTTAQTSSKAKGKPTPVDEGCKENTKLENVLYGPVTRSRTRQLRSL